MKEKENPTKSFFKQEELLAAIHSNDEKALKLFYQNNYYKTEKYVIENSGSSEQAKDIYQEAFIAVWENVKKNKFTPKNQSALNGYIYTIAKNKWLDYLKSSRFKKTNNLENHEYYLENELITTTENAEETYNSKVSKVVESFKIIDEGCKKLLGSFYYESKSLREIANDFNITEASARNKKYRCFEKLRALALTSN